MVNADVKFYRTAYSAGGIDSLGGGPTATLFSGVLHELFDYVSPEEAALVSPGDIEYRAIDVKNTHVSDTMYGAYAYISVPASPSPANALAIWYDSTGALQVADESTAPAGSTFSTTALSKASGISLGDIVAGGVKRIWVRWTVISALKGLATATIKVEGGTEN